MRLFAATTEPWQQLGNFAASLMNLDTVGDDSIEAVREKERMYEEAVRVRRLPRWALLGRHVVCGLRLEEDA